MEGPTRVVHAPRIDGTEPLISPGDWDEIDRIFDAALDVPEPDRAAFLAEACAGRPFVRRQIELLLAAGDEAKESDFLAPLPHQLNGSSVRQFMGEEQLPAGEKVGVYEIVRPIGRGGMGVVYLAERPFGRFKKPVALKVVKRGMDTEEIVQRFRFERQILAGLEHAHIARLLDGGVTDDGLPYFVMEYVEGKPIDQYCDDKQLSIRQRLKLFRAVCEAVAYAHRNLVVHRDLKPGNVMVSAEGEVKLLDFGIAKLVDPDTATSTVPITDAAERRMTPEYAAPEQVRGEAATTATDVYALGVILYELLSGRRPYRFKTRLLTEIEEKICQEVPGRPSTAVLRAEGDETPGEIGRQRSLSPEKLRKVIAGDLDAITMMAIKKEPELRYASAGELARDLGRYLERRPVRAARDTAAYRLRKFVERYRTTVMVAAFAAFTIVAGAGTTWWQSYEKRQEAQRVQDEVMRKNAMVSFISGIIGRIDPESDQGSTFTALEIIESGLQEIKTLDDQPRVKVDLLNDFGRISKNAGLLALADSLHSAAYSLQTSYLPPRSPEIAITLSRMAEVFELEGETQKAEQTFLEAISLDVTYHPAFNNLGNFYVKQGQFEKAYVAFQRALELAPEVSIYWSNLGDYYWQLGIVDSAGVAFERAVSIEPYHVAYANLATLAYYRQDYLESARLYRKAIEIRDKDHLIWGYLGTTLYWSGPAHQEESRVALRRAIELARERLAAVNETDAAVLSQLANYYALMGDAAETIRLLQSAELQNSDQDWLLYDIGYAYELIGYRSEAIRFIARAIEFGYDEESLAADPGMTGLLKDPAFINR